MQPFTRFSTYLCTLLLLFLVTPTTQGQTVLSTLNSPNEEQDGEFGQSVAGIGGDVNADGVADVIVGAHNESPGSSPSEAGRAYIISGATGAVLDTLASPNEEADGNFGRTVAGVGGDVNADGVPDVIVGASGESPGGGWSRGRAYIFSGATGALLNTLASPNGENYGFFGGSVAGIGGDVNADGVPDVIVGAFAEDPPGISNFNDVGMAYIMSGATGAVLHTLASPNLALESSFGGSVAGVGGDVNADGVPDVIVGASGETPGNATLLDAGRAYVFSGATGTLLHTLVSPNEEYGGLFGRSVAGVGGDVNADGVADVIVGAAEDPGSSPSGAGRAYILSGATGAVLHTLASPNEESSGIFSISVAGVGGDVNADGVPDIIVGAYFEDPGSSPSEAGRAYILSGADGSVLHTLASPNEEIQGYFGLSVAGIGGDVNADGVADVIVGARREDPGSSPTDAGRAYIFDVSDAVTNSAPTFNSSTTASIAENTSTSTIVLDVNADDGDGGSNDANVTYSLSGTDAGDFDINTNTGEITFTSSPDFENPTDDDTNNDYDLIVTADDGGSSNNTATQNITITVTDANDPPTDISFSSNNIDESATGVNANVGSLTTTDADVGDTHTYTLVAGTGDTDNGNFNINGSDLRTSSSLTAGNYSVRINTNDGTADYAEAFSITVNDDIAPSGYTVTIDQSPINAGNDNAVSFTFAGAEVGSTYDYEFTSDGGAGSVSNSGVIATATDNITGIDLSGLPDGTITLSVTLTDTNSNEGSAATDTATKDANAPVVNSVNVPLSDTYVLGQDLDFTVNFDENITVNTTGGTPQISLTVGPTSRQAAYQSGSGTQSLVFSYSVQDGDVDGDGIAVGTLSANGGTLQDAAGNDANLTLNSPGSTSGVNVLATDVTYTAGSYSPTDPSGLDLTGYTLDVQDGTAVLTASTTFDNVTVQSDAVLDLDANLSVNNELLFQSDASGTAQLADATGVNITGDVTVERFIPVLTEDTRGFRFLTSAVDSHASIFDNWQEGGSSPAGLGTHITGNNDGSNGVDQTITGNPSMYTFDNQDSNGGGQDNDWQPVTNTKTNDLVAGEAYRIFISGDRNYNLNSDPADPPNSDVTLRATGSLALGDQSYDLNPNQDEYSLVGNPYQAIVDMNTVMSNTNTSNINTNYYWVWDPNMSPGGTQGAYVAIDLSTGNSQTPAENPSSSATNQFVMPGQSFFVQTTSNSAADLEFTEASKDVSPLPTAVFSDDDMTAVNLKLYKTTDLNNNEFESDALQMNFDDQFTNAVTIEDADKLDNPDENLARVNNGEYLTIEKRTMPIDGETLAIFTDGYTATDYTFVSTINNMPQDVSVYLIDDHTGDQTFLNEGQDQISFMVDPSSQGSIATDRFSITFEIETVGVDDNEALSGFEVYPNPVSDGNVTLQAPNMSGEVNISLYNMIGQRVMELEAELSDNGKASLNIGKQQSGVYFIEVEQNGQKGKERLIIK